MQRKNHLRRFTALLLTAVMFFQMAVPGISALDFHGGNLSAPKAESYSDDDSVRVSIVLEDAPTVTAPYALKDIALNADAMEYRHRLRQIQELVVDNIETYALGGEELDVVWNLTLVANMISANVEYGKIDAIKNLDGVVDVFVENRVYLDLMESSGTVSPDMVNSSAMSGSSLAHAAGFTGAGSRVAVIDTGIDTDHRSFDEKAFEYSLALLENKGLIRRSELDLMTASTIEGVLAELNISDKTTSADSLYRSSKLPFAFNYADPGKDVNHHEGEDSKDMEHGSHVAGIAAANAYVPDGNNPGKFLYAAEAVGVCGMAPDAQILTMRVFDKLGGAYESTYMVAIEDAILLGADSINLSLGSTTPGFNRSNTYAEILENLVNSGTVCVASAGNNGAWADNGKIGGSLLSEDVNFNTLGSPGSFSTTLSVGSVDNNYVRQPYFTVDGLWIFYHAVPTEAAGSFSELAGEREYVYLPAGASPEAARGKIAVCQRDGKTPLAQIAGDAADHGALAVVIVNNEEGTLDPVLAAYHGQAPVITVSKADGVLLKKSAQEASDGGSAAYLQGRMTVHSVSDSEKSEYYTMSHFSSLGVPGNLSLAPDIVAPGGDILSVNGRPVGGQAYVSFSGTSMAGPQIAGMSAVLAQYVRELNLASAERSPRFWVQNLLMSTAAPFKDSASEQYYPVFQQGSGLADLDRALNAQALIVMDSNATPQYGDGKVKAEFGDDSGKTGVYQYIFTVENFSGRENAYTLSTKLFTQDLVKDQLLSNGKKSDLLDKRTTPLEAEVRYTADGAEVKPGESFTVKAGKSVQVKVEIRLTDSQKEKLNRSYPKGAYVEGYTFITGMENDEGVRDVEYSIPLIGFYGSWGDPSMFDHASYVKWLYKDKSLSYVYPYSSDSVRFANHFSIVDPKTDESRIYTGNPYTTEETFPADRGAIRSTDVISGYTTILIRSAAAACVYLTDSNGEWIGMGNVRNQVECAYDYKGRWMTTSVIIPFSLTPASMQLGENDVFNVNVAAVPEYYESGGNIGKEEMKALIEGNEIGTGTTLFAARLTVDDTAPQILEVKEIEDGVISVTARDNQYIAYMSVTDRSGTVIYGSCVPGGGKGEEVTCTFDLRNADLPPTCVIFVGDYAANSATRYYTTQKSYPSLEGKLGGYIHEGKDRLNKAWTLIDPETAQNDGIKPFAYHGGETVTAAAYVDGYIYQVIGSKLYTSPAEEIDDLSELVDLERFRLHSVSALSYNRTNHLLYALSDENTLWSIDPRNGHARKVTQITVSGLTGNAGRIVSMAIDDKGTFYGVTYYESDSSRLVKWTTAQLEENPLVLPDSVTPPEVIRNRFGSMTFDWERGVLYLAEAYADNVPSSYNRLLCIDPGKNTLTHPSDKLNAAVRGLFFVPSGDDGDETLKPADQIEELEILPEKLNMFITGKEDLSPLITPWNAKDKELIWESSDPGVVTVTDGVVSAVASGSATVTVRSRSNPEIKDSCAITVEVIPSLSVSAIVYEKSGTGYLADLSVADPGALRKEYAIPASYSFRAGGLSNGKLYLHNGFFMYSMDPDTRLIEEVMMFAYLDYLWSDTAQAPKGVASFYDVLGVYYYNGPRWGTYSKTLRAPFGSALPFDAPAATVAYIGDNESRTSSEYYILAENGALYRAWYPIDQMEYLGVIPGVNLKGVSEAVQGISASMWYDSDRELLVLSSRLKGEKAKIQLIDPKTQRIMSTTEFDENVWYATALFQREKTADSADKILTAPLPEASSGGISPASPANHSVYEGVERLFAVPILRPFSTKPPVARVGEIGYPTLQDAVNAAHARILEGDHAPQTVVLLADVNESVRSVWIRGHVDYDYELTLDLNGHTVTGTGGPVLWFEAGGLGGAKHAYRITIQDSSADQKGAVTGGTGRPDAFSLTNGGGIYYSGSTVNDSLTVSGGRILSNRVTGSGGGIAMSGDAAAQLILSGGVITENIAENGAVSGRRITVTGGAVTENQAFGIGGGLCLWGSASQELTVTDPARITGNTAGIMGDDIAVISQRGGVDYRVELNNPARWEENLELDTLAAWYRDGADGEDEIGDGTPERFDAGNPQILRSYKLSLEGRSAPAYAIAAKVSDCAPDESIYTVTYSDGAGGEVFEKQSYTAKAGQAMPPYKGSGAEPSRPGYRFLGWDPALSDIVTGNVDYVARWEEITAQSVTLDKNGITLNEGETADLSATVLPDTALNKEAAWSIGDEKVVRILNSDGNRITLLAGEAGTTTATAEINGHRASCTVTVNHLWEEPEFDWQPTESGYSLTATRKCKADHIQSQTVPASVQSTLLPTCTQEGSVTYSATVTFGEEAFTRTKTVIIPATKHAYGSPNFTWSEDGKTAVATFICEHNAEHSHREQAEVIGEIKKNPTCTEKGITLYTATVNFENREYRDTLELSDLAATGHDYGSPAFRWSADGKSASATFTCRRNPNHTQTLQASVSSQVKTPASCTANGTTTYTATVNFEGKAYSQSRDLTDLPMTGHRYSDYRYNNNATYWADGTETAACDHNCGTEDTRQAKGTKLTDSKAPTATVLAGGKSWSGFSSPAAFNTFFNKSQSVTIRAQDGESGVDKVYYYLSHSEMSRNQVEKLSSWTEYQSPFSIAPNHPWIVYVKVTDRVGNTAYYSSDGMILDDAAPVISGIINGKTYYDSVTVTVKDDWLDKVTVNGTTVSLSAGGQLELKGKEGSYTVIARDKAGNSTTVTVTLKAKALSRIQVTKLPDKTQYVEGESLNTAGMTVTAYYNDGSGAPITGYSVTGDLATPGTKTVTVSYQGKTASFTVTVSAKTVSSVTMKSLPAKTEYLTGESLNPAGGRITVRYNNGTSAEMNLSASMLSGYDPNKVGRQTVTVSYGGKTASFTVTTAARVPSSITSGVWSVGGGFISKIGAGTTAAQLLNSINEKAYCKVYRNNAEVSGSTPVGTGMEVRLMNGSTVVAKVTIVVTGDVNGDGAVTITDMLAVKSHLLNKEILSGAAAKAADASGDRAVSITDFIQIKAHILGKEKIQPRAC